LQSPSQLPIQLVECNCTLDVSARIQNANLTRPKSTLGFPHSRWPDASLETKAQRLELQNSPPPTVRFYFNDCHFTWQRFILHYVVVKRWAEIIRASSRNAVGLSSAHDETLSVVAVRIDNKDGSPVGINR
jgi:hypothetical protein